MTPYLFHTLDPGSFLTDSRVRAILSGDEAWRRHIAEAGRQHHNVGMWGGDQLAIAHALKNGLIDLLPPRNAAYSYFCGTPDAFTQKDMQIITAACHVNRVSRLTTVDLVAHFAKSCIVTAIETLGGSIDGVAIRADVLFNGSFPEDDQRDQNLAHFVIACGGTYANPPKTVDSPDPKVNTATCLAKIERQHGTGVIAIETCDGDGNAKSLLQKYSITKDFEAFILSAFARAASQGIITDPKYDIFRHWKAASRVKDGAVELLAIAKDSHTLPLSDGDICVPQGTEVTVILSQKWGIDERREIARMAGLKVKAVFASQSNPEHFVMVYEACGGTPCAEVQRRLDTGWTP